MSKVSRLKRTRNILSTAVSLAAIVMVVLFAQTAGILPAPPVHAAAGGIMQYGVRMGLLILFIAGCAFIGLLFVLARFERLYRYPVPLNSKNIEVQFALAKVMLSSLQMVCAAYICVMMVSMYRSGMAFEQPSFFMPTILALAACGAICAAYLAVAFKNK